MNEEDRKRFARYRPGYIEPPENDEEDIENDKDKDKKSKQLGYIDKIEIDKDKFIIDTIQQSK